MNTALEIIVTNGTLLKSKDKSLIESTHFLDGMYPSGTTKRTDIVGYYLFNNIVYRVTFVLTNVKSRYVNYNHTIYYTPIPINYSVVKM